METCSSLNRAEKVLRAFSNTNVVYGCSPPKLAKTLGKPEHEGPALYEAFWKANPGIGKCRDALLKAWEQKYDKKFILTLDGTKILTRKKNAILNSLFQSAGAIIMDYALDKMDRILGDMKIDSFGRPYYLYKGHIVRRIGYFHDESEFECQKGVGETVSNLIVKSIVWSGETLKMKVPLAGEGKVGQDWSATH